MFRILLYPFSLLYGLVVGIRNILFDCKILKSIQFNIPVISVGNITVGGTGKTPHVEYLINLLKEKRNIAVLSRGYKRKTKGFQLASSASALAPILLFNLFQSQKAFLPELLSYSIKIDSICKIC